MPFERKGKPHPSGRPIRRDHSVGRPMWRIPDDGPNLPKLKRGELKPAIGFVHDFSRENGYEDE